MTNLASTTTLETCAAHPTRTPTFQAIEGRATNLGGLAIRRLLPRSRRRLVGPWCFLDSFGPLSFSSGKPMDVAPHPHIGAYSPSKAGLRALCQTLALEHARDGILVNEVAPGIVDAGLSRVLFEQDAALKRRTLAAIPTGRIASPEDVARDVCFLASPENRHTTGSVLVSDGGLSLASVINPGSDR